VSIATGVKVNLNEEVVSFSQENKKNIMYGEYVDVFESEHTLRAFLEGHSYGNVNPSLVIKTRPSTFWFLVRVEVPGSHNPSLRFGLAKIYRSVTIRIKKWLYWRNYAEFSLTRIPIIAMNNKTKIIDN